MLTSLQQIKVFWVNYMERSKHDSYCQKSCMLCSYSDTFMYEIQLIDCFITAGVFSLEYFYIWLAEKAKDIEMLSSILVCCLISYFLSKACAKSPRWLTVIKIAEVLIWNKHFAVDNHKIDRLFLGSILSWTSEPISFWRMTAVLISVILGSEVPSFIHFMKMNILQYSPWSQIIFVSP